MKNQILYFNYLKNVFAVIGVCTVAYSLYAMKIDKSKINTGGEDRQTAINLINAFREKAPNVTVKGYFLSNEAIQRLQGVQRNNGIFIYPGFDKATSKFCIVTEGGNCSKPSYRASSTDPVFIIGDNLCPTDCGTF